MRSLLTLVVLLAAPLVAAQSFTVTVQAKTAEHPYSGQGDGNGYAIDGFEGAELTLVRGRTYTFEMSGVPTTHPFYVSTSDRGAGASPWTEGVTGNGATGSATLTFTVPDSAPDQLWYQCQVHAFMGWKLNIVTSTDIADEAPLWMFDLETANPSSGGARFSLVPAASGHATVEVFAADGRRVAVLLDRAVGAGQAQAIEVPALAAGIYIVRARVGDWWAERRVTVAR